MAQAKDALRASQEAFDAYQHWVASNILTRRPVGVASQEVMEQGAAFEAKLAALDDLLMEQVRTRSAKRLSAERTERAVALSFVAAMVLAAIIFAGYLTRGLTRSMRRAVATFAAIESGEYENTITVDSADEAGQVLRSLDKMQAALRVRIEADRRALAENTRVRQALDNAGTIMLVVDEKYSVVYANETAKTTFAKLQADIAPRSAAVFRRLAGRFLDRHVQAGADPVARHAGWPSGSLQQNAYPGRSRLGAQHDPDRGPRAARVWAP